MDHIVYLDYKAQEMEKLRHGSKNMIIRGAMGRKLPHGRVSVGDQLYFVRNNGEGVLKARARVSEAFHSEKLSPETSEQLVLKHQERLGLDARLLKRFSGKRYLVFVWLEGFEDIQPLDFDRSQFGNMDDWLPVGNIAAVTQANQPH